MQIKNFMVPFKAQTKEEYMILDEIAPGSMPPKKMNAIIEVAEDGYV